jgi:DNA-binding transcriptional LysR family regulator
MLVKMNLDRFNLNLFVAFEALSKAETLTQAADALYVTQSTLSVALRQMREYFDDELFVYKPKQKELTPLAQNLRPRVLEILKTAKATLMLKEETARFDATRCLALVPDDSLSDITQARSEDALFAPRVADLAARGALANAKSQSHVQRRALKSRLLAELD